MQIPAPDAHQCVIGVAIALPSHYAAQVRAVREAAGDPLAEVVPPHITLLPPTAVDVDSLDEVMRHLRNVAAGTNPFEVRLDEVGTFRPVSPVVYLGLRSGAEECDRLQVRVRDRRGPLARSLSFPFHPHVTLAHLPDHRAQDRAARVGRGIEAVFVVEHLHLEAVLRPVHAHVDPAHRAAVAARVGERLLNQAVDGQAEPGGRV